jgi:hypothetical protein
VIDLIDRDGDAIAHHFTVIDVQAEWVSGEARAGDDAESVAWVRPDRLDGYDLTEKLREVIAASARLRAPR